MNHRCSHSNVISIRVNSANIEFSWSMSFYMKCWRFWKVHYSGSNVYLFYILRFGRKTMVVTSTVLTSAMTVLCGFSPTTEVFLLARVLSGVSVVAVNITAVVHSRQFLDFTTSTDWRKFNLPFVFSVATCRNLSIGIVSFDIPLEFLHESLLSLQIPNSFERIKESSQVHAGLSSVSVILSSLWLCPISCEIIAIWSYASDAVCYWFVCFYGEQIFVHKSVSNEKLREESILAHYHM